MHLGELGQTFVVRLVMHPKYHEDGHKTHYPSSVALRRRTTKGSSSRRIMRPSGKDGHTQLSF